jgi:hypothetical protein
MELNVSLSGLLQCAIVCMGYAKGRLRSYAHTSIANLDSGPEPRIRRLVPNYAIDMDAMQGACMACICACAMMWARRAWFNRL